jgi:hypothetical protein
MLLDHFGWEEGVAPFIIGGRDARRVKQLASEGRFSMRLRDDEYMASSVYLPEDFLSEYTHFQVDFSFITKGLDFVGGVDSLFLEGNTVASQSDDPWDVFGEWVYGTDFVNNERKYISTSVLDKSSYEDGPFVLRFRSHASKNQDRFYLDEITIVGCNKDFDSNSSSEDR